MKSSLGTGLIKAPRFYLLMAVDTFPTEAIVSQATWARH